MTVSRRSGPSRAASRSALSRFLYDDSDRRLLEMVNALVVHGEKSPIERTLFDPWLHPRGIKELAAPKPLRIASAMLDLLGSLAEGSAEERVAALRAVKAEVFHDSSQRLRLNAARVTLQIMKELVRVHGDEGQQLDLAQDFRLASTGKPRAIRRLLTKYHLLEMPEAWNQLAFDHHVHDANTKGRKSPTHLIMDAWIKGIRFLGVVYYDHVRPDAAAEMLEAGEIMGVEVRIGVEVSARLRDKRAALVWAPRGFHGRTDFLDFLDEPDVRAFMAQGRAVAEHAQGKVLERLRDFNRRHLPQINAKYGVAVPPLDETAFMAFVATGQASLVHLAEFAHATLLPYLRERVEALRAEASGPDAEARKRATELIAAADDLVPEVIVERYLRAELNPAPDRGDASGGEDELPELLRLGPAEIIDRIEALPCRSRITLNPSLLTPADVLEVLYAGRGRITHLEIFNLKDWAQGHTVHRQKINEIRLVLNSGNLIEAKRLVRGILRADEGEIAPEQTAALREILHDLPSLLDFYRQRRLKSRLGSDSIGRSRHSRGMGLVVIPTLPVRVRRQIRRDGDRILPVCTTALRHTTDVPRGDVALRAESGHGLRAPNGHPWHLVQTHEVAWSLGHNTTTLASRGNIAALGGLPEEGGNGLVPAVPVPSPRDHVRRRRLSPGAANLLKIVVGFLPAFLTFYLTKDWWVLAYFGAVIWFAITGLRNILQSVVGGGGLRRTSLLTWNDFVSWSRVADSLLFTGFSVPLLDYVVKDQLLAHGLGVTTATSPTLLYAVIALANGIYISSHNAYRGLPLGAVVGNFFRTVLSSPLALGLNYLLLVILLAAGVTEAAALGGLQLWAAVISKAASDLVAALIEGSADRQYNLAHRNTDYSAKLGQVYDVHGRVEMLYPEEDVPDLMEAPDAFAEKLRRRAADVFRAMVSNALDLLYFWMYQPRAETALRRLVREMSEEELEVLVLSQQVLTQKRIVANMLLEGLVGERFERPLAFYLSRTDRYLDAIAGLERARGDAGERSDGRASGQQAGGFQHRMDGRGRRAVG